MKPIIEHLRGLSSKNKQITETAMNIAEKMKKVAEAAKLAGQEGGKPAA